MRLPEVPQAIRNTVFIQADPMLNAGRTLGDTKIVIDQEFEPHATEHVTQEGTVLSAPQKLDSKKSIDLKRGDYVYTHHFLCDADEREVINGVGFYKMMYEMIHCIVKDGKITMLNDWNFIDPYKEPEEVTKSGIILVKLAKDKDPKIGIARHISDYMKDMGVKSGDKIYFTRDSDYEMIVEGKIYWRMRDRDIIGIVN